MNPLREQPADSPIDEFGFSRALEALRPALRVYILSIFPHPHLCEDIVQETILFAWDRRADFRAGSNFKAWVFKVGYFKMLAHRRDVQRDKLITFSEDTLQTIAGAAENHADSSEKRLEALQRCLAQLQPKDLALLKHKYLHRGSLTELAHSQQMQPNRLQKAISRLRLALRHCIEGQLSPDHD